MNYKDITILNTGTSTLVINDVTSSDFFYDAIRLTGTITLAGNYNVAVSGTPDVSQVLTVLYEGIVTPSSNHIYILGTQVPDHLLSKQFYAFCYYDGSAWVVTITPTFSQTEIVDTVQLKDSSVTTAKVNNSAITDAKINDVDGSKIANTSIPAGKYGASSIVSADIASNAIITAKIANSNVTLPKIANIDANTLLGNNTGSSAAPVALTYSQILTMLNLKGLNDLYTVSIDIPTDNVLQLFATPQILVGAPGVGKAIQVISATATMVYNSVPYATNGNLDILTNTATIPQATFYNDSFLFGTVSRTVVAPLLGATFGVMTITDTQIIENEPLLVKVETANPTAGNSDITINVLYRLISL